MRDHLIKFVEKLVCSDCCRRLGSFRESTIRGNIIKLYHVSFDGYFIISHHPYWVEFAKIFRSINIAFFGRILMHVVDKKLLSTNNGKATHMNNLRIQWPSIKVSLFLIAHYFTHTTQIYEPRIETRERKKHTTDGCKDAKIA